MFAIAAILAGGFAGEKVTEVAQNVGSAGRTAVDAVGDGVYAFADSVNAVMREATRMDGKGVSVVDAIRARQEARKLGVPGSSAASITPEKRRELEKLKELKADIMASVICLDEEVENLRSSIFHVLFTSKIVVKEIKKRELSDLHRSKTWAELQEKVTVALGKEKVVVGRHSRTLALLHKIQSTSLKPLELRL